MTGLVRRGAERAGALGATPAAYVLACLAAAALLAVGSVHGSPQAPAARAAYLDSVIRCPSCTGLSIAQSDDPIAVALRAEVRRLVDAGWSNGAIERKVVAEYHESVLLSPPAHGLGAAAWFVPLAAIAAGAVALGAVLVRRRRLAPGDGAVSAADAALVEAALRDQGGP
ncbi:MAG TPA: cytochrome c-type biogenesis protein CcmH [Acidimicrobiales bacterium]|nr:cytochrome c-type biogenesis protein CcmH [Acidimicrobiales bacterium]